MSRVTEAMRRVASDESSPDVAVDERPAGGSPPVAEATRDRFAVESAPPPVAEATRDRFAVESAPPPVAEAIRDRFDIESAPPPVAHASKPVDVRVRHLKALPITRNPKLVSSAAMPPLPSAQYRRLAAALHDLQQARGSLKILMVSSTVPQEGKTLTLANLALTFSESYQRRTLVIDGDLRSPRIHTLFGVPKSPGLGDLLADPSVHVPLIQVSPTLSILPAGRVVGSPLAQFTSGRFRDVVRQAAAHFDWVLFDTPPIRLLPDAQHVAAVSDGTLLVIAAGSTPYKEIQRAIASIGAEHIVGTLLNRADKRLLRQEEYSRYFTNTDQPSP